MSSKGLSKENVLDNTWTGVLDRNLNRALVEVCSNAICETCGFDIDSIKVSRWGRSRVLELWEADLNCCSS